jgi:hypothetical protein
VTQESEVTFFAGGVQQSFPRDQDLVDLGGGAGALPSGRRS